MFDRVLNTPLTTEKKNLYIYLKINFGNSLENLRDEILFILKTKTISKKSTTVPARLGYSCKIITFS